MAEGSSSWSLGEYAVSIRSDLRSTAKHSVDKTAVAEGSSSWSLGEHAVSIRLGLRSAAKLILTRLIAYGGIEVDWQGLGNERGRIRLGKRL